ncbi:MAG: MlaD family protein [Candidatus Gastranaerophilaceae bacterium]
MKISSSFKVGILSLVALMIFFCTVLWVKGRAFSSAKRIEIQFKDVNGMRPGSAVQMMGMRVGQVEEIKPVITADSSYVLLKFVITDPNIKIPKASMISIQQSGLIGEQFLEITPPKTKSVYVPVFSREGLYNGAEVEIKLDDKYYTVGSVKNTHIMASNIIPIIMQPYVKTQYAYKVDYTINLPGLILPEFMVGEIIKTPSGSKLRIKPMDNTTLPYPHQTSLYTVIEPMRIADFLDLQYQAAASLTETNKKINDLLDDALIADLKQSIYNVKSLTAQATTTLAKTEKLVDDSRKDLETIMVQINKVSNEFCELSGNINNIIGDPQFKPTMLTTAKSISKLSDNLVPIIGAMDAKKFAEDLNATMTNITEITTAVNAMTKDEKLKTKLGTTVDNMNKALYNVSLTLETINNPKEQANVRCIMQDTAASVHNLRKFSDKLNKRFLLFRLLF